MHREIAASPAAGHIGHGLAYHCSRSGLELLTMLVAHLASARNAPCHAVEPPPLLLLAPPLPPLPRLLPPMPPPPRAPLRIQKAPPAGADQSATRRLLRLGETFVVAGAALSAAAEAAAGSAVDGEVGGGDSWPSGPSAETGWHGGGAAAATRLISEAAGSISVVMARSLASFASGVGLGASLAEAGGAALGLGAS